MRNIFLYAVLLCFCFGASKAQYIVEHLCEQEHTVVLNNIGSAASLTSFGNHEVDCRIVVLPIFGHSLVLSIKSYKLDSDDVLTIEDSDRYKVQLLGWRDLPTEKTMFSSGSFTIYYKSFKNNSLRERSSNFEFLFTEVHELPCGREEFECRNKKCIASYLKCNLADNCGDRSDEENCYVPQEIRNPTTSVSVWPLTLVIAGSILIIIVIVILGFVIRSIVRKNKENKQQQQQTLPHVSPDVPQQQPTAPPAGYFERLRNSLRGTRHPPVVHPETELHQTPSMYPHLSAGHAADVEGGIDNTDFRVEE